MEQSTIAMLYLEFLLKNKLVFQFLPRNTQVRCIAQVSADFSDLQKIP
jgi:endonuclease YncB( thermonuclease family)